MSIDEKALAVIDRAMEWRQALAEALDAQDDLSGPGRGLPLDLACVAAKGMHRANATYSEACAVLADAELGLLEALDAYTEAHIVDTEDSDA